MNKAWFLNYWGQDVNDWKDFPTRDHATSTSYKLEWTRFEQDRVTEFLTWQAGLVRANARPDQFVTQDYGSMMRLDVNEPAEAPRCWTWWRITRTTARRSTWMVSGRRCKEISRGR